MIQLIALISVPIFLLNFALSLVAQVLMFILKLLFMWIDLNTSILISGAIKTMGKKKLKKQIDNIASK